MDMTSAFLMGFTWPVIICLVLGIALLILEMFTPGFGVAGGLGLVLLIVAVALHARTFAGALLLIALLLLVLTAAFFFVVRFAAKGSFDRLSIVNRVEFTKEEGFVSNEDMIQFVGRKGTALSTLRPAGMADFDGVRLDVVSEGGFLPQGSSVVVTRVEGYRVVVKADAPHPGNAYAEDASLPL